MTRELRILSHEEIVGLDVEPRRCVEWTEHALREKHSSVLPPKISLKREGDVFFNTMPSFVGGSSFGVKVVSRYPAREPSLMAQLMLYDQESGDLLSIMDASWITTLRTGACAALTIRLLARTGYETVALVGLGNTARATLLCLLETREKGGRPLRVKLLSYKDHAQRFIERFRSQVDSGAVEFTCHAEREAFFRDSDVIVSCVTAANELLGDEKWYGKGVLVVPVHTRGFQDCDLTFDRVFGDDRGHIDNFKHYPRFKDRFSELSDVLVGAAPGRRSDEERILVYNIGISILDVKFAEEILRLARTAGAGTVFPGFAATDAGKFWV